MGKRIFITGAVGFIGYHLALRLAERGDQVLGFDNFNDYYSPHLKRMRDKSLRNKGIHTIEGDICHKELLTTTISDFKPTHIVHLAAQAGVRYSLKRPDAYIHSNIEGFLNILEVCRRFETPLTYASSSSVYGLNKKIPFSSEDRTEAPANLYAATKKAGELMAFSYHHCYGLPVTALRYFTVFGPWGRPDMAYYLFAKSISEDRPISLYNGGQMARDFTYIDDIVDGTVLAIDKESEHATFNLGSRQPIPLMKLVSTLEEGLGKKANIEYVNTPAGEIETTCACIEQSHDILGYEPKVRFEEGMAKFLDWFLAFR